MSVLPYHRLTRQGQLRRLHGAARAALARYDLDVASMHILGNFTNMIYKVTAVDGRQFVLRLNSPGWRTEDDLRAEVTWLQALSAHPEIGAPIPLPARDGNCLVQVQVPGLLPLFFQVQSFIPGTLLSKRLDEAHLHKMGVLFARLHIQAAGWTPPKGFTTRRMECVLARQEPDVLFTPEHAAAFTSRQRQVWDRTRQVVEQAYARLYASPGLRVIHHDLWHDNIKVHQGQLHPLDFEDTAWGYPVQDIAMAMQDLMQVVTTERYEQLVESFRAGYETLQPWPEAYPTEMDTFRAGRVLWVTNWVAEHETEHLPDVLKRDTPALERFLETGKLRIAKVG